MSESLCECGKPVMIIDTIYRGIIESLDCLECHLAKNDKDPE